ncbi:MAG: PadR family transcriptional regulator [Candidatus Limnocylindrales bacterium]
MGRDPLRTELMKGAMAYLVLSVLREGELYGYQIAVKIRERSDGVFFPSEGSLYPTLHRLETEGGLEAVWRAGDKGPRRRWYRITPAGHAKLTALEEEWSAFSSAVHRVAARREPSGA